tara:strand:- start:8852 stop:9715 length:864 start_codon:yes stop_codon:yes gene_type:complete
MGNGRFSGEEYTTYSTSTRSLAPQQVMKSSQLDEYLDPRNFELRESCDGDENPEATPVIIAVDVTGSMGHIAHRIVTQELGKVVERIYEDNIISDPHVMVMAIGDMQTDGGPLQMSQFEAEVAPLVEQIEKIWVEGHGGNNSYESYAATWLLAHHKTVTDSWTKRNKRGYIFTLGDERPTQVMTPTQLRKWSGIEVPEDISSDQAFATAMEKWEPFHLVIMEGNYASYRPEVIDEWQTLMGQRAIQVNDYRTMGDKIIGAICACEDVEVPIPDDGTDWAAVRAAIAR